MWRPSVFYFRGLYDAFANEFLAGAEIDCSPRTQLDRTDALAEGSESLQSFLNGGGNPRPHHRNYVAECAGSATTSSSTLKCVLSEWRRTPDRSSIKPAPI